MLQHCNRIHTENYNESCCLQHLIEMNEYAELKTLHDRYARLLMKTLNHSYKLNEISFRQLNLTYVRSFLDIMTKYIAHFYFLNKFDYSKLLVKIALKATDDTPYKDHPEIIMRTSAVFNNIACIYESIKSYEKALRYLNYNKKISMPTHDKLIFLNNLIRINLKLNRKNEAEEILKNFAFIFKDVIKTMKKEMHTNDKNTIHSSQVNLQKLQLLAYLYYNWGMCLEILQKKKEAKEVFNKGYQFCLCWLGEFNLLTRKFIKKIKYNCEKLSTIHTPIQIKNKRNCFDSDGDPKKNNTDAMRKKSSHSILPLRSTTDFSSPIRLRHNLSLNKDKRKGKDSKNEFNLKLDMIINRLDHLDTKIVNETLPNIKTVKPTEMDQTQDEKDKLTHDQNDQMTNKRENFKMISSQFSNPLKVSKERASVLSVDRLKMMMKPKLRILIETTGNNKSSNNNVIDDIMKEVQDEAVRKSRGSIGSLDIGRKSSLTIKDDFPRSSSIKSMNNDSFIGRDISIIQSDPHLKHMSTMSLQSKDNGKINEVQGDINKKDLKIKKLFNKVLDIKQPTKSSLQTQGKLAGILSQLVDSKDNETNKMPDRKSEQFMYHNLMDKLDKEENYVEVNRSLTKEENLIDEMTKDNNCLDNDLKENLKSEMKQMTISLNLEDEDTKYEFVPYFQTKPNDNKEENQEPISMATIQDSNPKEKLIKEMNNFSFNVIAHEDEDTYECKTLYFGNDSLKEKPKSNGDSMLKSIVSGVKIELNDYACDPKEVIEADIKFETYQRQLEGRKMKNVLSTANYFDSLDKTKLPGRDLVQMRLVQRENYKVIVKFPNENEIKLQLEQKEKILAEQLLSYDKIKGILNKLYIYNALPRYLDLHSLGTIQKFFEHLFIYHVSVIKKGETNAKFSLGVTPRPIGICPEKVYQFTFLKTNCFIDIIILQNKQTNIARLFIYNHINDTMCLQIDLHMNRECFEEFVKQIPYSPNEDEVSIPNFELKEKHLEKNAVIPYIITRIQEILKLKYKDPELTLEKVLIKIPRSILKCNIKNMFSFIDLSIMYYEGNSSHYIMDYFTLCKVKVNKDEIFISRTHVFDRGHFASIVGYDSNSIRELLSEKDKMFINYLLMNSIEIDSSREIQTLPESVLFSYRFVLSKNLLTLGHKVKGLLIMNFEVIFYSMFSLFFRLVSYDPLSMKENTKIFLIAMESLCGEEYPDNENIKSVMKNKVENMFRNKRLLKDHLIRCWLCNNDGETFKLFSSGDELLLYFKFN